MKQYSHAFWMIIYRLLIIYTIHRRELIIKPGGKKFYILMRGGFVPVSIPKTRKCPWNIHKFSILIWLLIAFITKFLRPVFTRYWVSIYLQIHLYFSLTTVVMTSFLSHCLLKSQLKKSIIYRRKPTIIITGTHLVRGVIVWGWSSCK